MSDDEYDDMLADEEREDWEGVPQSMTGSTEFIASEISRIERDWGLV